VMFNPSVTTQQPLSLGQIYGHVTSGELFNNGTVSVRNATESEEDIEFVGKLVVEGFERKFVHATSRASLPAMRTMYSNNMKGRPPLFYERHFIAEYNADKAGVCVLRYHGDSKLFPERDEDVPPLGCCDLCGLALLNLATSSEVPAGKCYVDHICVDSRFRGKGIGKVLLDMAEVDAKKRGCKVVGRNVKDITSLCCCGMWCLTGEREFALMEKVLL
uniref:N-acetyltransferase domain-containing protein n=1 Tax=Magallana gigas TaxID=29159 RepID=A0A8W8JDV4_MAGGI